MACSKRLIEKVSELLNSAPLDEEQMYILNYRLLDIWTMLTETNEYSEHKKYYNIMIGKDIQKAVSQLELLHFSLKER